MAYWISGGILLLALVWLVVVALSVASTARRFHFAALSLVRRLKDGQTRLEPKILALRERALELQRPVSTMQRLIEARQPAGDNPHNS